jgi:hypothetical protein
MMKRIFIALAFIFLSAITFSQKKDILKSSLQIPDCYNLGSENAAHISVVNISTRQVEFYVGMEFFIDGEWKEFDDNIFSNERELVYKKVKAKSSTSIDFYDAKFDRELILNNIKLKYRFKVFYLNPFDIGYFKYKGKKNKFLGTSSIVTKSFNFCLMP